MARAAYTAAFAAALARIPYRSSSLSAGSAPLSSAEARLAQLTELYLQHTQVTDAGCATLAAALNSGALPALEGLYLSGTPASAAAKAAVYEARANLQGRE